jgi:pyrimidine deaminase RibD-like protein
MSDAITPLTAKLPAPMTRALALAHESLFLSSPNPHVGCVITSADGRTLGEGFTQQAGGPHAEVMALRDAQMRGHDVRGATAWVTLEPCAHTGRTGPCCDALAAAGIGKVVAALEDPNPKVAGQGLARLAELSAAITTEFENVPAPALAQLALSRPVAPGAACVAIAQDRIEEKAHFHAAPTARGWTAPRMR